MHPWEIDPEQPRVPTSLLSRFRHYTNLTRCEQRLVQLTQDFSFTTMSTALTQCESGLGLETFNISTMNAENTKK
jgi:hypothetical protein